MKFTLPAPASVEWYRSGVPGGGQKDRIFNRLKAKLIGGKDDSGTGYFPMHDRKISSSDADKIIANMKQDEDGYPMLQTGSTSGEAEREYQEWIIDRYLVDTPKTTQEPENIPVEIEVVEVEQKTVDEPIVVKIEAPFEPEPKKKLEAPKRIRLPRRSGVMKARPIGPPKKSVATRMAEAFDRRLDDVVDSIQNPPAPAPPKQRKQKESLVKIKKKVKPAKFKSNYKEKGNVKPFENLGKYGFNKIKSALGRAADARRMAQEQGLPEQEKGFYATRALGFEFGGDKIARVRGTFAKSPDATLDPSLSKQQRYTSGLFGTRTIRPPAAGKSKGGGVNQLDASFNKLTKRFDEVIEIKKQTPSSDKDVAEFNKVVEELKEALQKGNKHQKEINDAKKEQASIARDAANDAEAAAEEAALEQKEDSAGLSEIEKSEKKKKQQKKKDGGGFNPFDFLKRFKGLRKLWRRIRNPKKTIQAIKRLATQKINKALKPVKAVAENVATQGRKIADGAIDLGKRLKGGAADAATRAGGAIQGGLARVGGWLTKAKDAVVAGGKKAYTVTSEAVSAAGGWLGKKWKAAGDLIASAPGKVGNFLKKMGVPKNWDELAKLARSDVGQKAIFLAMGPIGKYVIDQLTNPKSALKVAQRGLMAKPVRDAIIKRGGRELLEKILAKFTIKVGGQAVPAWGQVLNLGYGIIEAIVRGVMGDLKGSALSLGSAIPWVGAGFSIVDIIRDIDIEAYTRHIEPNLGSIATGDGSALVSFFNDVAGSDITTQLESDPPAEPPSETASESKEGETKLSSGGVVPAMVGEAGPELVTNGFGGMNPLQSLAPMIVAMREVTKRAGTWADPVENMVRQATDPIAKQLKLPVLPTTIEIGQGAGSKGGKGGGKIKKKKKGGLAGIMEKLGELLGSKEAGAGAEGNAISVSGGAKGVLDLIASVESNGSYDIFNTSRAGTPGKATEKTIQWLADNAQGAIGRYQHMPEYIMDRARAAGYGPQTLFTPDVQDAITIKMLEDSHGLREFLSGSMSAETFAAKLAPTWRGLPQGPEAAARLGGTADSTYNDQYAGSNAAHMKWADSVATLRTVQGGGGAGPGGVPPNPGGAMPMTAKTKVIGDSIANGFAKASSRSTGLTKIGDNPSEVLSKMKSSGINSSNTSNVVLSTGLSNNTGMKAQAEQQMRWLQSQGIAFTVLPVSNAISAANGNLNQWLANKAAQYGGGFASGAQFNHAATDPTKAHPERYLPMVRAVTLGTH